MPSFLLREPPRAVGPPVAAVPSKVAAAESAPPARRGSSGVTPRWRPVGGRVSRVLWPCSGGRAAAAFAARLPPAVQRPGLQVGVGGPQPELVWEAVRYFFREPT